MTCEASSECGKTMMVLQKSEALTLWFQCKYRRETKVSRRQDLLRYDILQNVVAAVVAVTAAAGRPAPSWEHVNQHLNYGLVF